MCDPKPFSLSLKSKYGDGAWPTPSYNITIDTATGYGIVIDPTGKFIKQFHISEVKENILEIDLTKV